MELAYLAAPLSHPEIEVMQSRVEAINRATAHLFEKGVAVISLVGQCWPISQQCGLRTDFEWWRWYNKAVISRCGRVIILKLDGWQESIGVKGEVEIAEEFGIPVEYMEPV